MTMRRRQLVGAGRAKGYVPTYRFLRMTLARAGVTRLQELKKSKQWVSCFEKPETFLESDGNVVTVGLSFDNQHMPLAV